MANKLLATLANGLGLGYGWVTSARARTPKCQPLLLNNLPNTRDILMQISDKVHLCTIYNILKLKPISSTVVLVMYRKPINNYITQARVSEIYLNFNML
jgi:hypothetical protein